MKTFLLCALKVALALAASFGILIMLAASFVPIPEENFVGLVLLEALLFMAVSFCVYLFYRVSLALRENERRKGVVAE